MTDKLETLVAEVVEDLQPIFQKKDAKSREDVLGQLLSLLGVLLKLKFTTDRLTILFEEQCRLTRAGNPYAVDEDVLDYLKGDVEDGLLELGAALRRITIDVLRDADPHFWPRIWERIGFFSEMLKGKPFNEYIRRQKGESRPEQRLFDHFAVPGRSWHDNHEILKPFEKFRLIGCFGWWANSGDNVLDNDLQIKRIMEIGDSLIKLSASVGDCLAIVKGVIRTHWNLEEILS